MMNKGDFIFECSRSLGLDDEAGSEELILQQRWLGRGVVDVLVKTHCYMDIGTMGLQPGVTDYRTDDSVLALDNVTAPDTLGSPYELDVLAMDEILPYLSPSIAASATPTKVAIEGTLMRIAPIPASAITLTYIYVPRPTSMGEDGTKGNDSLDPSTATYGGIPPEYHDAILMYMIWQGAQYDQQGGGFYRGHAFAPGSAFQAVYQSRLTEIKKELRRKAGRGMHRARIGYPDRVGYPIRNDVYPSPRR